MSTTDLATSLLDMSALKTQTDANILVMKQQFAMEKSVLDILDPTPGNSPAPAPAGMGQQVDKTA